jgi:endonuclease/exonuclease/phosphatase family metal-dependent hydrolase
VLRFLTWNIEFGYRLPDVLDNLRRLNQDRRLDLLAIQEASVHDGREDWGAIAAALGPEYRGFQVLAHLYRRRIPQANAVIWDSTRIAAAATAARPLPSPASRVLQRVWRQDRNVVVMEGVLDGRTRLRCHSVHLDVLGIAHKLRQFEAVLDDAAARGPAGLALIAGDLNTYGIRRPGWRRLRELAEARGYGELTLDAGPTHVFGGVRQQLDRVFAAPVPPHRSEVLDLSGSDHLPVLVELELP